MQLSFTITTYTAFTAVFIIKDTKRNSFN